MPKVCKQTVHRSGVSDVQSLVSVKIKHYNKAELLKYPTNLQSSLTSSIMKLDEPIDPEKYLDSITLNWGDQMLT